MVGGFGEFVGEAVGGLGLFGWVGVGVGGVYCVVFVFR